MTKLDTIHLTLTIMFIFVAIFTTFTANFTTALIFWLIALFNINIL